MLFAGGCLTFAKRLVKISDEMKEQDLVQEVVQTVEGKNVLANGFDYRAAIAGAFTMMMPQNSRIANVNSAETDRQPDRQPEPGLGGRNGESPVEEAEKIAQCGTVTHNYARCATVPHIFHGFAFWKEKKARCCFQRGA
ncbi:hypothetical protein GTO91_16015 [Heliobacterium undosum]|uniref:Tubulin-like protein TubZ-like C-terminal domain-containing protein n=1 Tax=Heliomicrobium undosum TaxID=121734 RepID=A0A845L8U7_9FIRM|nr:hypothetical protein [Heliomicrobium undosum]MZP31214.1 hypothetical protein [Heliomicrobium undosum]